MTQEEEFRQRDLRHAKLPLKAVMQAAAKALNDELCIILGTEEGMSPLCLSTHEQLLNFRGAGTRLVSVAKTLLESARDL